MSVSLCVSHMAVPCKMAELMIEMPLEGGLSRVCPRNHVLDGVKIPHGMGQFWGVILLGSCCCSICSKKDNSVINDITTCNAAFRQNCLTMCFWFLYPLLYKSYGVLLSLLGQLQLPTAWFLYINLIHSYCLLV